MATLLEQCSIATDGNFVSKVQQAAVKAAIAVASEDAGTTAHAKRVVFGNKILNNPRGYAELLAKGVATNASISLSSSDNDIEFTVNSMFTAYALDSV
jgi:hypothetical protein